jgi:hypothetical protein
MQFCTGFFKGFVAISKWTVSKESQICTQKTDTSLSKKKEPDSMSEEVLLKKFYRVRALIPLFSTAGLERGSSGIESLAS